MWLALDVGEANRVSLVSSGRCDGPQRHSSLQEEIRHYAALQTHLSVRTFPFHTRLSVSSLLHTHTQNKAPWSCVWFIIQFRREAAVVTKIHYCNCSWTLHSSKGLASLAWLAFLKCVYIQDLRIFSALIYLLSWILMSYEIFLYNFH